MTKTKFIISTDSSADIFKSDLEKNNIYCIVMKRILNNQEIGELYDSAQEFDNFYEELKGGALPTTTQLNSYELQNYFSQIMKKEKQGDIIHIALSSGLSGSCDNAKATAEEINKTNSDRKIYVVDSLLATGGIAMLIDELLLLRDSGVSADDAVKKIEELRNRQQAFVVVSDLFHLKRGGRISGIKAALGTLLNMRPIVAVSKSGRLVMENTIKGDRKAIKYVMDKIQTLGEKSANDFFEYPIYVLRTSKNANYDTLKNAIYEKYPTIKIKECIVGPIVGTHLGCDSAAVVFYGAQRLDI